MKRPYSLKSSLRPITAACGAAASIAACATSDAPRVEPTSNVSSADFQNGGFETGTAGLAPPAPWAVQESLDLQTTGFTLQNHESFAGLNLQSSGAACPAGGVNFNCQKAEYGSVCSPSSGTCLPTPRTVIVAGMGGNPVPDPTLSGHLLLVPRYGTQCALVNQLGNFNNVNDLSQPMPVSASDIDPADGQVHVRFAVAPVFDDALHPAHQEPYYFIQVTNTTRGTTLYSDITYANEPGMAWQALTVTSPNAAPGEVYRYTQWQLVDIPAGTGTQVGDQLKLEILASGCAGGGHLGELYVDGVGTKILGLNVSGTAPAQVMAGADLTYALTYRNGATTPRSDVVITFETPPQTTFGSVTTPASWPATACSTPAPNAGGQVICNVPGGNVAQGASGSLSITVHVLPTATGTIVQGDYGITSTEEPQGLLGNKIETDVDCTSDADCIDPGTPHCDTTTGTCVASTNPGLDGGGDGSTGAEPDGGADGSPGVEQDGGPDGSPGTTPDGGDAGVDSRYVEGGGCATAPGGAPSRSAMLALFVAAVAALKSRRGARRTGRR